LLKLKPWQDAEAIVVGHTPGKGKYQGMAGALQMAMPDGKRSASAAASPTRCAAAAAHRHPHHLPLPAPDEKRPAALSALPAGAGRFVGKHLMRHCEERSDAAIQRIDQAAFLDCFASPHGEAGIIQRCFSGLFQPDQRSHAPGDAVAAVGKRSFRFAEGAAPAAMDRLQPACARRDAREW